MNEQNQKTVIMNIRGSLKGAENDEGRGKRRRRGGGGKTLIESLTNHDAVHGMRLSESATGFEYVCMFRLGVSPAAALPCFLFDRLIN
jgi:hypothetical protein